MSVVTNFLLYTTLDETGTPGFLAAVGALPGGGAVPGRIDTRGLPGPKAFEGELYAVAGNCWDITGLQQLVDETLWSDPTQVVVVCCTEDSPAVTFRPRRAIDGGCRTFARFTEYSDDERTLRNLWLQVDGNEAALSRLDGYLKDCDDDCFELAADRITEVEVDLLVKYSEKDQRSHTKLTGSLILPNHFGTDEPHDWFDDGAIGGYFKHNAQAPEGTQTE
ncbi:hypothetical protein [Nocardia sp. NPDC052566]|uniref:hypothetical protein n=1 Tax=Nocardia sp. NPDC052566 TaxID=3364330 RepID=UPI0037C825F2